MLPPGFAQGYGKVARQSERIRPQLVGRKAASYDRDLIDQPEKLMARNAKPTLRQIEAQIELLQKQATALRSAEMAEVIAKIKSAIAAHGLTAEQLGFGGTATRKVGAAKKSATAAKRRITKTATRGAVKFADGQGNSWTGHGKRPNWFKAAIEAGTSAKDLLV